MERKVSAGDFGSRQTAYKPIIAAFSVVSHSHKRDRAVTDSRDRCRHSSHSVMNVPLSWMSIVSSGAGPALLNLCGVFGGHHHDLTGGRSDLLTAHGEQRFARADDECLRIGMLMQTGPPPASGRRLKITEMFAPWAAPCNSPRQCSGSSAQSSRSIIWAMTRSSSCMEGACQRCRRLAGRATAGRFESLLPGTEKMGDFATPRQRVLIAEFDQSAVISRAEQQIAGQQPVLSPDAELTQQHSDRPGHLRGVAAGDLANVHGRLQHQDRNRPQAEAGMLLRGTCAIVRLMRRERSMSVSRLSMKMTSSI